MSAQMCVNKTIIVIFCRHNSVTEAKTSQGLKRIVLLLSNLFVVKDLKKLCRAQKIHKFSTKSQILLKCV